MFPSLIILLQGKIFFSSDFPHWSPTGLKASLASKDWDGKDFQSLSLFHVLCHQVACPIQQWKHIFSGLPFVAEKPFWLSFTSLARSTPGDLWLSEHIPACSGCVPAPPEPSVPAPTSCVLSFFCWSLVRSCLHIRGGHYCVGLVCIPGHIIAHQCVVRQENTMPWMFDHF